MRVLIAPAIALFCMAAGIVGASGTFSATVAASAPAFVYRATSACASSAAFAGIATL